MEICIENVQMIHIPIVYIVYLYVYVYIANLVRIFNR